MIRGQNEEAHQGMWKEADSASSFGLDLASLHAYSHTSIGLYSHASIGLKQYLPHWASFCLKQYLPHCASFGLKQYLPHCSSNTIFLIGSHWPQTVSASLCCIWLPTDMASSTIYLIGPHLASNSIQTKWRGTQEVTLSCDISLSIRGLS